MSPRFGWGKLFTNASGKIMILRGDHQTWMFRSPNLDVPLLPLGNVVIEGEQEGEGEEKAEAGKKNNFYFLVLSPGEKVPDVMVVEIVETLKAFLVELF